MGRLLKILFAIALFVFLPLSVGRAEELGMLNLDDAAALGTTIENDAMVKAEGQGSIKISAKGPVIICLGEVSGLDVDNAQLIYQARVKSENLVGNAFLEMWCEVNGGQYFSRGMNSAVTGNMDWTTVQTPFLLQKGQKGTKVTLNLVINGAGTVWVDDIHVTKEALK